MPDDIPSDDEFEYLYELYHKNLTSLVAESELAGDTVASEPTAKRYRRADTVPLADPEESPVLSALAQRASYTDPAQRRPVTESELATLLAYAYGETRGAGEGPPRRPVPSGGARYPLELYPIILDSPDLDDGIYHFNVRDDALEQLQQGDYGEWVRNNWTWVAESDPVTAVIVITALPERSATKYDELGYLFAGIETGAVVQNLQLVATELEIGSRPHNGLNYRAIREELRLPREEYLMSTVVFAGTAPE